MGILIFREIKSFKNIIVVSYLTAWHKRTNLKHIDKQFCRQIRCQIYPDNVPNLTQPWWRHFVLVFTRWYWQRETQRWLWNAAKPFKECTGKRERLSQLALLPIPVCNNLHSNIDGIKNPKLQTSLVGDLSWTQRKRTQGWAINQCRPCFPWAIQPLGV